MCEPPGESDGSLLVGLDLLPGALVARDEPKIELGGGPRTDEFDVVLVVCSALLVLIVAGAVLATGHRAGVPPAVLGAGAAGGFGMAVGWAGAVVLVPWAASTEVPALLAMIFAGAVAAVVAERRPEPTRSAFAAVLGAMTTGVAAMVVIDLLLPLSASWTRNSAPPWTRGARLVDPVGRLVVVALLAVVVALSAGRASRLQVPVADPAVAV